MYCTPQRRCCLFLEPLGKPSGETGGFQLVAVLLVLTQYCAVIACSSLCVSVRTCGFIVQSLIGVGGPSKITTTSAIPSRFSNGNPPSIVKLKACKLAYCGMFEDGIEWPNFTQTAGEFVPGPGPKRHQENLPRMWCAIPGDLSVPW